MHHMDANEAARHDDDDDDDFYSLNICSSFRAADDPPFWCNLNKTGIKLSSDEAASYVVDS